MKDLGDLKWFLGTQIIRDWPNRKLWLLQDTYIDKIANRFLDLGAISSYKGLNAPIIEQQLEPNIGQASPQEIY